MPMPAPFDGYVELVARVSSTCLITVQRNRYSVPCHLANHLVSVHLYPEQIAVYAENERVACHLRLLGRDQICYDWQHYILLAERKPGVLRNGAPFADMPVSLLKLQTALLRREGGDRVMAKVLAAVPHHGGLSRNPRKFRRSSFSPAEALRHRAGQSFARMTGARLLQPVGRAVQLRQISLEDTTP